MAFVPACNGVVTYPHGFYSALRPLFIGLPTTRAEALGYPFRGPLKRRKPGAP